MRLTQHFALLQRDPFSTAVTLAGDQRAFGLAPQNNKIAPHNVHLAGPLSGTESATNSDDHACSPF